MILNRGEGGGLTVNLQGPLVFNPVSRLGRQLVLTSSRYAVRFPLETQAPGTQPAAARSVAAPRDGVTGPEQAAADDRRPTTCAHPIAVAIPSPVVVTESPGNVIRDGHGSRWQEEGA